MKTPALRLSLLSILCCWLAMAGIALAAPSAEEIVKKANLAAYYAGNDGSAQVSMTITDSQGRSRNREFAILRRDLADGGAQTFYVYFRKPADVRKMVFMVHKQIDRDDDRWLYLPALDLVKRIASSDKRTSFVGSHFYYEDVSGRSPEEDRHELLGSSGNTYQLKHTPKEAKTVEFAYYTTQIDKTSFLPVKAEYFDKQGKKYRVVEALEVKSIGGHPTVVKSRVQDLAGGGETVSVFGEVRYDLGLSAEIFTERYLRNPPKEIRK